jgi:ribonuclease HI
MLAEVQAILLALRQAPRMVAQYRDTAVSLKPVVLWVCSDCQAALRCVFEEVVGTKAAYWTAVVEGRELLAALKNMDVDVHYDWIPGHVGTQWNELADTEARAGMAASIAAGGPVRRGGRPMGLVCSAIKHQAQRQWAVWGTESTMLRRAVELGTRPPKYIGPALRQAQLTRLEEVCIGRLRTGTEMRPSVLRRMGIAHDGRCPHCKLDGDCAVHRIEQCVHYGTARRRAAAALAGIDKQLQFSMATIVGLLGVRTQHQADVLRVCATFMRQTGLASMFVGVRERDEQEQSDSDDSSSTATSNSDNSDSDCDCGDEYN